MTASTKPDEAPGPVQIPSGRRRRRLLISLGKTGAATAATAVTGSLASSRGASSPWFARLRKPRFQPPGAAFPIVWSALYADIAATSAVAVERLGATDRRQSSAYARALAANLALNAAWSWVFFRAHRLAAAAAVAGALTVSSTDLTRRTGAAHRTAGWAMAPYPLWCAFATVLSGTIWWKNRR